MIDYDKLADFAESARNSEVPFPMATPSPGTAPTSAPTSPPAPDVQSTSPVGIPSSPPPASTPASTSPSTGPGATLNLTDTGNAERLVRLAGQDIRSTSTHGWLVWDGTHWVEDDTKRVLDMTKTAVRAIYREAARASDPSLAESLAKHAIKSESSRAREAMLSLASCERGVAIRPGEMNSDPWLFNCQNGTVDLKTGQLRPHDRGDLITRVSPVPYLFGAKSPIWKAFLERVLPDAGVRTFVKRFLGYSLTGSVRDHVLSVFWGSGRNGKTTLLDAATYTMGDYFVTAHPGLLLVRRHEPHPTERATLFGRRLAVCMETGAGERLNEPLVKALTGGDTISARKMRQDEWNFTPTHKLVLVTNSKPRISGTDEGIWRRIRLVPFSVTIPEDEVDSRLPEKLRTEASGILNWLVEGCLEWQMEGLKVPTLIQAATDGYREEQDSLAEFLTTVVGELTGSKVKASVLYQAYLKWAEDSGETPVGNRRFGESLGLRGYDKKKENDGWYYQGVILQSNARGG